MKRYRYVDEYSGFESRVTYPELVAACAGCVVDWTVPVVYWSHLVDGRVNLGLSWLVPFCLYQPSVLEDSIYSERECEVDVMYGPNICCTPEC